MPAWLLPLALSAISGGLGYLGQRQQNKEAKEQSQKQMDFQERMSSTAAQRSVEDYTKAGLNPALAYERTASSPGGASAVIGNAVEKGMSSAKAAAEMAQQLQLAKQKTDADSDLARSLAQKARVEAASNIELTKLEIDQRRQALLFGAINQPFDTRHKSAEAILRELLIPGAKNTAAFEEMMGKARPGIASAKTLSEIIKMLNPSSFRR